MTFLVGLVVGLLVGTTIGGVVMGWVAAGKISDIRSKYER